MMKNVYLIGGLLAALVAAALAAESGRMMSVQVKSTPVRETPSFVGKAIATLSYGDRVEVLETQGVWLKVRSPDATGWTHNSALSTKRVTLRSGQDTAQARASSDELALAGKGFNSDVESEYKKQHRNIDFTPIDRMEKTRVSPSEIQAFFKAGGVMPREGGAK
jgi:uncharacterized protein YgiM (DUF1202 family)